MGKFRNLLGVSKIIFLVTIFLILYLHLYTSQTTFSIHRPQAINISVHSILPMMMKVIKDKSDFDKIFFYLKQSIQVSRLWQLYDGDLTSQQSGGVPQFPNSNGGVVPQPIEQRGNRTWFSFEKFAYRIPSKFHSCPLVMEAFQRLHLELFYPKIYVASTYYSSKRNEIKKLKIFNEMFHETHFVATQIFFNPKARFSSCSNWYPNDKTDESYHLNVQSNRSIFISTSSYSGLFYALQTLSQLIKIDNGKFYLMKTIINDFPRFPYRGIMIDTARHYLSMNVIKKQIEAMGKSKMNVLHWHIYDEESFPLVTNLTLLWKKFSFNSKTHIYKKEDIRHIEHFARFRGVRIMLEYDLPGHAASWKTVDEKMVNNCSLMTEFNNLKTVYSLNVRYNKTFHYMKEFLKEALQFTKSNSFHLGMDEVQFDCWLKNLKDDPNVLYKLYEKQLSNILSQYRPDIDIHFWDELLSRNYTFNSNIVIHQWRPNTFDCEKIKGKKVKVVRSECWYVNMIKYGEVWREYYDCDPHMEADTCTENIIGGEVCAWAEFIDDTNLISTIWPFASVIGERLWSSKDTKSHDSIASRINEFRCKLIRIGINARPSMGSSSCPTEFGNLK